MRDSLVAPLRVVLSFDPAIDRDRTDIEAYAGGYVDLAGRPGDRDESRLVFLPGQRPIWFTLRPITVLTFANSVESQTTLEAKYVRAFQWAVSAIEGLGAAGEVLMPDTGARTELGDKVMLIGDRLLNMLGEQLSLHAIYEIGRIAYQRATEGNTRGGGVNFTLPPSSRVGSSWIAPLPVEQTPTP